MRLNYETACRPSGGVLTNHKTTMNEARYIIIKRDGEKVKFLRHEGHQHFWTQDRTEAMEYTKIDVAQALAQKMRGELAAAN